MTVTRGAAVVDTEACKGCALCAEACPQKILAVDAARVNRRGYPYAECVRSERCTGCAACATVCPDSCITVYRKRESRQGEQQNPEKR